MKGCQQSSTQKVEGDHLVTKTANPKKKDSAATREAILTAARSAFTQFGYEGAGVREIAAAAGIHPSLVNRYFGTKEQLFEEAVPATFSVDAMLPDDKRGFGFQLASYVLTKEKTDFDATLAMIRSVGNKDAAAMLRAGLEERFVGPLAAWLGAPSASERAGLVISVLAGVAIMRDILDIEALKQDHDTVCRLLGETLDRIIDVS